MHWKFFIFSKQPGSIFSFFETFFKLVFAAFLVASFFLGPQAWADKDKVRIVTLSPHLAEIVSSLDLVNSLVGVSAYSNFPASIKNITVVGDALSLNLERIKSLNPDFILVWKSGTGESQKASLRKAFINTKTNIIESDANSLDEIADEIERLGKILQKESLSKKIAQDFRGEIAQLKKIYSTKPPLKVFYQAWSNPLITIDRKHLIGDMVRTCGGELIFDHQKLLSTTVSREQVIKHNPDVIMTAVDSINGNNEADWSAWKKYPKLSANKLDAYLSLPGDLLTRPTVRTIIATKEMCDFFDQVRIRQKNATY
jgi:iron complex transport system substrate-binding protein